MNQKKSGSDKEIAVNELNYEQALSELEAIVLSLESDELALDAMIKLYERGQSLAKRCSALLDQAELKFRQITENEIESLT